MLETTASRGEGAETRAPGEAPSWTSRHAPLLLLLLLALAVRCIHLDRGLWLDEGLSLQNAVELDGLDGQRPLYFLFLRVWMLAGRGEVWLRVPSVLFGVASVAALYALGRRLAGPRVAFIAALLLALSTPLVRHAQEVRMYSLAPLLVMLTATTFLDWLESPTTKRLLVHALCAYLTLMCHTLTSPGLAAFAAIGLVSAREHRRALVLTYAALLVAWSPFVYLAATHQGEVGALARPTLGGLLRIHDPVFVTLGRPVVLRLAVELLVPALVAVALLDRGRTPETKRAFPLAFWYYAAIGSLFVGSFVLRSMWLPRYFCSFAPALFLLTAMGAVRLGRRVPAVSYVVVAILVGVQLFALRNLGFLEEDWRAAAWLVRAHEAPADRLYVMGAGKPPLNVWTYYDPAPATFIRGPGEVPRWDALAAPAGSHVWIVVRVSGNEERPAKIIEALGPGPSVRTQSFAGVDVLDVSK